MAKKLKFKSKKTLKVRDICGLLKTKRDVKKWHKKIDEELDSKFFK